MEVRLGNLWSRLERKGRVGFQILRENRKRFVMERNCLEKRERDSK
jgi:hypothetical protein